MQKKETTPVVRIATAGDEPEILRLLLMMHKEGGLLSLDVDAAKDMFRFAFNRKGGLIGVIGAPNDIQGMIYLLITRFWYTRENHLEELFNYVRPDCRHSNYANTLITFAKKCADEIKIPLVIGVLSNQRTAAKVRLYRRSLGFPMGAFFVYGGNWPNESVENTEDFWQKPFPAHTPRAQKRNGKADGASP